MAIDFNATTSKLEHTTASGFAVATRTILAHVFPDGNGEAGLGTIFGLDEGHTTFVLRYQNTTDTFRITHLFDTTTGVWTVTLPLNQWNALAISYDNSDVANDPVARNNYTSLTVTRVTAPVGTAGSPATGYIVGAATSGARTWDGAIAHLQFFNVILTANEMDMALRRPGSVRRGMVLWLPMYHSGHTQDWSGSALNGTASNLGTRDGPPCQAPWSDDYFGWRGAFTAVAAANTWPGYYQSKGGWF